MNEICFIGDIHGCVEELAEVVSVAMPRAREFVFLGDYINRGRRSKGVIDYLIDFQAGSNFPTTFLAGNHDRIFLQTLINDGLDEFLIIGGASTIISYVGEPLPDVLSQLRLAVPESHLSFLKGLKSVYACEDVIASHEPDTDKSGSSEPHSYAVFGHSPLRRAVPQIGSSSASIDTGCGTLPGGKLTGFFWPSKDWIQSKPWRNG
ncbi:metallophosphoesterase [Mycobacteroides abscessus]